MCRRLSIYCYERGTCVKDFKEKERKGRRHVTFGIFDFFLGEDEGRQVVRRVVGKGKGKDIKDV